MPPTIILLGPPKAGKSTVGKLLAERLNLSYRSTHEVNLEDYAEFGYDDDLASELWEKEGAYTYCRYAMPFGMRAIEKLLAETERGIVEIHGDYSVFTDEGMYSQIEKLLAPYDNVVQLLPSPDQEKSVEVLRERGMAGRREIDKLNDHFVENHSNYDLAKFTVYTKGKTPEESRDEILSLLGDEQPATILMIGPVGTGKSTLSTLLAEKLQVPHIWLDKLRWAYYKEIGYDEALAAEIRANEGMFGLFRYWSPFHAHAVERALADYNEGIIDFGGGHSVYDDDTLFARVQQVMAPFKNVVLVLPSPDKEESFQILRQRGDNIFRTMYDADDQITRDFFSYDLAKLTVYTEGKTPEETCEEISSRLKKGVS